MSLGTIKYAIPINVSQTTEEEGKRNTLDIELPKDSVSKSLSVEEYGTVLKLSLELFLGRKKYTCDCKLALVMFDRSNFQEMLLYQYNKMIDAMVTPTNEYEYRVNNLQERISSLVHVQERISSLVHDSYRVRADGMLDILTEGVKK